MCNIYIYMYSKYEIFNMYSKFWEKKIADPREDLETSQKLEENNKL